MAQAKEGDTVKVHYTGKLDDGTVFDSSRERDPLEFKLGSGQVIPGFENGIVGMEEGGTKTVTIPPEEAYGAKHDGWPRQVKKDQLPEGLTPQVGTFLQVQQPDGSVIQVIIAQVNEDDVVLDNHPLAGQSLHFDVELVAIG
jgi:FKBP-type peptidyl-prolyl cis-trans isomerase 2